MPVGGIGAGDLVDAGVGVFAFFDLPCVLPASARRGIARDADMVLFALRELGFGRGDARFQRAHAGERLERRSGRIETLNRAVQHRRLRVLFQRFERLGTDGASAERFHVIVRERIHRLDRAGPRVHDDHRAADAAVVDDGLDDLLHALLHLDIQRQMQVLSVDRFVDVKRFPIGSVQSLNVGVTALLSAEELLILLLEPRVTHPAVLFINGKRLGRRNILFGCILACRRFALFLDILPRRFPHDRGKPQKVGCGAPVRIRAEARGRQRRVFVDADAVDRQKPFLKRIVHLIRIELCDNRRRVRAVDRLPHQFFVLVRRRTGGFQNRDRQNLLDDLFLLFCRNVVRYAVDRDRGKVFDEELAVAVEDLAALRIVDTDQQLVPPLHRREDQCGRPENAPASVFVRGIDRVIVDHLAERGVVSHLKIDGARDRRIRNGAHDVADLLQADRFENLLVFLGKLACADHGVARFGGGSRRVLHGIGQQVVCRAVAALRDIFDERQTDVAPVSVRHGTAERQHCAEQHEQNQSYANPFFHR